MWQMCQPASVFLILNCLSVATFFRQTSSWFLASLLTLSAELSVSVRGGEKRGAGGGGESAKPNWHRGMRVRYQKTGIWGMSERSRVSVSVSGLRGQGLYRCSPLLKQQPARPSTREPNNLRSCIVPYLLKKTLQPLFSLLPLSHNHPSLHIWWERIERVPYCPLSGDVGVCVRAWLLLVYIRVLNSRIGLSIWARQIYLCCGSFMHLLFPKRIGMHQWKRG